MKNKLFLVIATLVLENIAVADTYRTYNGAFAADYASTNFKKPYSPKDNPFYDYNIFDKDGKLVGNGNCTNFVSQALIAGFIKTTSPMEVYNNRKEFDIEADQSTGKPISTQTPSWYFWNSSQRGDAWAGATNLYKYVKYNKSTYKGLHFKFITKDTQKKFMDYNSVRVGDVIFADWTGDGIIDHSMIVTEYDYWTNRGYNKIKVCYQSNDTCIRLGVLNESQGKKALFEVYRPTDYNPNGL